MTSSAIQSCLYADLAHVHTILFVEVSNAAQIKKRIISAATVEGPVGEQEREAVNFAFIDARLVTSPLHLQTAIYQALLAASQDALRTKTVHSEIIWALNPTNNISEAIRRYGVSETSTSLLVIRVDNPTSSSAESVLNGMKAVVEGRPVSIEQLPEITDWNTVKKYLKLNGEPVIKTVSGDPRKEREIVNEIAISTVAMKSVAT